MEKTFSLPGYEILRKVGESAMAAVWAARRLSQDRVVAVKVLSPALVSDGEAVEQFLLEARAVAGLKHPGIVPVHDAGRHEDLVYIVMEYIGGCTVAELLERKGRLAEKHALLIGEGIALALAHAWDQAGLVHGDVRPANIVIEEDGSIKLTDLGLARIVGMRLRELDERLIEGTAHYASPEQVRGESDLDARADVYSLGATLYHVATGQRPFGEHTGRKAMEQQLAGHLPDPQEVCSGLSDGLTWLIEKMMVKDRALRYAGWSEVDADMGEVIKGRVPSTSLPAMRQSTVLRRSERTFAPPRAAAPAAEEKKDAKKTKKTKKKAERKVIRTPAPAKQKIVLSREMRDQLMTPRRKMSSNVSQAVGSLVLMVILVFVAYGGLLLFRASQARRTGVDASYWERTVPPRSAVQKTSRREEPVSRRPSLVSTRPATKDAFDQKVIEWRNPTFLRAARLFNDALEKYKQYMADRKDPSVLATVERQCREAIAAFESVRSMAPDGVDIGGMIDQCYGLIADTRQSTLVASAEAERKAPSAARPSAPRVSPTPGFAGQGVMESDDLVLAPGWNSHARGGETIMEDLDDLLRTRGQADVDLSGDTSLVIFGQVYYLMPIREFSRFTGQRLSPRKRMSCPGFPKDSLYYYTAESDFGDGFDEMLLVTDSTDRIVAVQLVNAHPDKSLWLDAGTFSDKWHTYNFVQGRTKGSARWRVGQRVETQGRVVRIDSELVSDDENGYFGLGDSKERVRLYLPEKMVNLILFRINSLKKS